MRNLINKIGIDKILHCCLSGWITMLLMVWLPWYIACGFALAIGIAKELYDKKDYGDFSIGDLIADIIGITISVVIGG